MLGMASDDPAAAASLRCRIGAQSWMDCRMITAIPGEQWSLVWGQRHIDFRHDGSGTMLMRMAAGGGWIHVQPLWTSDQSLCWETVCAKGKIPLD